jgi:peptide methionine sulfoxide reductase MsrA
MSSMSLILLGGCFWGLEHALRETQGSSTETGYAGGPDGTSPTYYDLDRSGHSEGVRIAFPAESLPRVLDIFAEHSFRDPSPASKPRYRRAVLCPDQETALLVRSHLGETFETPVGTWFVRAADEHQKRYARMMADG